MVYSLKIYSSLLVSLVPWFLLIISLSDSRPNREATTTLITQICSQTQNSSPCLQVFQCDPHSASADLSCLGKISITIARNNAKQTSKLIASLLKGATSSSLKGRYGNCAQLYGGAIDDLKEAGQILDKMVLRPFDISTFRTKVSAAFDGPSTCEDGFEGPPNEPSELKEANKKFKDLCDNVLVIGASLKSG